MRAHPSLVVLLSSSLLACSSSDDASTAGDPPDASDAAPETSSDAGLDAIADADSDAPVVTGDPSELSRPPLSCAFQCPRTKCSEDTTPYACPAMAPWATIPHAESCGGWDGTYPAAKPTACTVSGPAREAAKYAGVDPDDATITILPDGRRVRAAGAEWLFDEADLGAQAPQALVLVPGTTRAIVVDVGYGPHSVRVVDTSKVGSGSSPVLSYVRFDAPSTLNASAAFVPPDLVLVATNDGQVQALSLDPETGALARDDARSIALPRSIDDQGKPANYYVGGLAVSPDHTKLLVTSVFDPSALVFSLGAGDFGTELASVAVPRGGTFAAAFDPADASGRYAYATLWGGRALVELDLADLAAPKLARTFPIVKNPQGLAFLDARWIAVANDFGDAISLVDRVAGTVTDVPVDVGSTLHGAEPSTLAYDAASKRLYATLAGANAVAAWDVDVSSSPPTLSPAGRLPTSWWPSSVAVLGDGALAVLSMRGHSNGRYPDAVPAGGFDAISGVRGGLQIVPKPDAPTLRAGETTVARFGDVGALDGAPKLTCPAGVRDFAVPETNVEGPSPHLDHVFFIVRENKPFDGLLADVPGVNGDASLLERSDAAEMNRVWRNFRDLARTFATSDNYYTDAELSDQGHTWATYGRSSDFTERTWSYSGGYTRNAWTGPVQPQGTVDIGQPVEGSIFDWLLGQSVSVNIFGEGEGLPQLRPGQANPSDFYFPGGFRQTDYYPDVVKACYLAGRMRAMCDLASFGFMTFPNDHTGGASPNGPSTDLAFAVNDEGTGMFVDALSHSPLWATSLVVVVEDDPGSGRDHVDVHRTANVFVSPWIKRGYVSKTHVDVSSLHKLVAHVFGVPYPNEIVAKAALPLDLFSSTPDYTPFAYVPREASFGCGAGVTAAEARLTASWDFDELDHQPGLEAQLWRVGHGRQLDVLPPALEREVARREAAMAARRAAVRGLDALER